MQEIQNLYWVDKKSKLKSAEKIKIDNYRFLSFQWLQYLLILLNTGLSGWAVMQGYLDFYTPKFVCDTDENTGIFDRSYFNNSTVKSLKSRDNNCESKSTITQCESCPSKKFIFQNSSTSFDSLTAELNLICDNDHYVVTAKVIAVCGIAIGCFTSGLISDNFGRQKAIEWGHLGNLVVQCFIYFSSYFEKTSFNYYNFYTNSIFWLTTFGWFLSIIFSYWSHFGAIYCLQDFVPKKYQPTAMGLCSVFWCLNYLMLNWCYPFSSNWRTTHLLQIVMSLILYLSAYFFIEESIYWLITRQKMDEAQKIIDKYRDKTGSDDKSSLESEQECRNLIKSDDSEQELQQTPTSSFSSSQNSTTIYSFIDLFLNGKNMTLLTIKLCFMWSSTNFIWYALTINAESLPVSYLTAMTINGFIDIIFFSISGKIMTRFGRKKPIIFGFFGCALFLAISTTISNLPEVKCAINRGETILQNHWILTSFIFLNLGRCLINVLRTILLKYTVEIYPVQVSGNAVGLAFAVSNVVCIFTPVIIWLQKYYDWLPNCIHIILALVSGFATVSLRETVDLSLLLSFEQADEFYTKGVVINNQ